MPTPVLSPWNGGSGFGPKDVEPKKRLVRLLEDASPRLSGFRGAFRAAQEVVRRAQTSGWIAQDGRVVDKARVVQEFRNLCPDELVPWIDASVVLAADKPLFPPILGTGGNDGRLDFSTNFHEQLLVVLDGSPRGRERSWSWARDLLAGRETERLAAAPVGQFDPARAGGQGSSPYGAAASLVNPWEYVLLVEGALLFASGAARRHQHDVGRAAMPFTVTFSPDGSVSGSDGEESRGEVWVPVWQGSCTLAEIRQLFGEARASWRGRPARRAVDFYAATRALGVARGVGEFVRYGLQQRNGLAFVAVPLDRVQVRENPDVRLLGGVEDWVARIPRGAGSRAVSTALRQYEAAELAYARDGGALALRDLLAALTALELAVGRSGRAREQVRVRRAPGAVGILQVLIGAECRELRIAVGLASCATMPGRAHAAARTMRQILLPVDPWDPADRAHRDGSWRDAPIVPGFGSRPLAPVLADVLAWRSRTAADEAVDDRTAIGFRGVPTFRRGLPVPAADLHALARGQIDQVQLDTWLRACLALDWRGVPLPSWKSPDPVLFVPALALLHPLAAVLADSEDSGAPRLALGADWAVRLAAGQIAAVHLDVLRRLSQAGWDGVPPLPETGPAASRAVSGAALAAALVPRCLGGISCPAAVRRQDQVRSSWRAS